MDNFEIDTKILKIFQNTQRRDGTPYTDRNGKNYSIAQIYVDDSIVEDKNFEGKISFLDYNGVSKDWKEGDELKGIITRKDLDGKVYWNYSVPNPMQIAIGKIIKKLKNHEERIIKLEGSQEPDDELPF